MEIKKWEGYLHLRGRELYHKANLASTWANAAE